jgi:pyruvate/2-oxoglutarate dehydrogenase complex dihydrolipoamide acyltransferase (E2) component
VAAGLAVGGCSGSGRTSAADLPAAAGSPTLAACTSTFLGMSLGHRSGTATITQALNLTNNGQTSCVLDGYPGVNLVGEAHGLNQYTWTLRWATAPHSPVTLAPGGTAHFDVVYLPASSAPAASTSPATPATTTAAAARSTTPSPKSSAAKSAKPTATKPAAPPSPPVDIDVLDITITLPNTYSQDETAWNARLVLQDNDAHAQTYVTPFVAGSD